MVLFSQVDRRVAAKSKGLSDNSISPSSFWGKGRDVTLFLIFSLPSPHLKLEAYSPIRTKVTEWPMQKAFRRWGHCIVKTHEHICGSFPSCFCNHHICKFICFFGKYYLASLWANEALESNVSTPGICSGMCHKFHLQLPNRIPKCVKHWQLLGEGMWLLTIAAQDR